MQKRVNRRSWWWIWGLSILVSGFALAAVLSQLQVAELQRILAGVDPRFLLLAFATLAGETAFASVRLRVLLGPCPEASWTACLRVTSLHGVYLVLLPARLGEVAYLLLLNRAVGQRVGAAIGNLVYQRLSDAVVLAFLLVSTLLLAFVDETRSPSLWLAIVCGGGAVLACWLHMHRLVTAAALLGMHWFGRRARLARHAATALLQARRWSRRIARIDVRIWVLALTLAAWLAAAAAVVLLFRAFGAALDWEHLVLAGIAIQLISAIPVYTIGGLGVAEAGLAGVLVAYGVGMAEAASLALAVRLGLVLGQIGVAALVVPATGWRKPSRSP